MKSQQQGSHSRRNGEICAHICSTKWAILLRSRYVRCKVWVEQWMTQGTCTVRIYCALLSRQNAVSQRGTGGWHWLSQHLGEYTTPEALSAGWWLTSVSVSDATVSERSQTPKIERRLNHEKKTWRLSVHHITFACPTYRHLCGSYAD